jgi:hypothetical protein
LPFSNFLLDICRSFFLASLLIIIIMVLRCACLLACAYVFFSSLRVYADAYVHTPIAENDDDNNTLFSMTLLLLTPPAHTLFTFYFGYPTAAARRNNNNQIHLMHNINPIDFSKRSSSE